MSVTVTSAMPEYLAEIYRIAAYQDDPYVSTSLLADRLQKSAPAVVRMASRLKEEGLIEHEPYKGISLTPEGERVALYDIRKHRIVEVFLVKVMGFGWHEVHESADDLAKGVNDQVLERMEAMSGYPRRCPHGEPIPTFEGIMPLVKDVTLTELNPEHDLTVSRINTHDAEKLKYLHEISIVPGQDIRLVGRAPFNGPLRLRIGKNEQVIGTELATAVRVCERGAFEL